MRSSPHVRGEYVFAAGRLGRFTPTCVGINAVSHCSAPSVHPPCVGIRIVSEALDIPGSPHVRGNTAGLARWQPYAGSPHVRGNTLLPDIAVQPQRFTPTCVEGIRISISRVVDQLVHPHVRGNTTQSQPTPATRYHPTRAWEYRLEVNLSLGDRGSPHVRGVAKSVRHGGRCSGSPHVRGEPRCGLVSYTQPGGSLRAWGIRL